MTGRLQEKNGRFYMIINLKDEQGRHKNKWIKTGLTVAVPANKALAEKMLRKTLQEYERNEVRWHPNIDFIQFIRKWLEVKHLTLSENTHHSYQLTLKAHLEPYFAGKKLGKIGVMELQNYYLEKTKQSLSANTLLKHNAVLNGALAYAEKQGLIPVNPMQRVTLPKKQAAPVTFFSRQELIKVLEIVQGTSIEAAVKIALYTGFRRSEVMGLRWRSVDFENNKIYMTHTAVLKGNEIVYKNIGKSKRSIRAVDMAKPLQKYLQKLYAAQKQQKYMLQSRYCSNDFVCKRGDGRPLHPNYVTDSFKRLLVKHDLIEHSFHTLRHSAATYLLSQGFQLIEIQHFLGHLRLESTVVYAHLQNETFEKMGRAFDSLDLV